MQDAFAESLVEATTGASSRKPKLRTCDAQSRRQKLLEQHKSAEPPAAQWRYRMGHANHELRKLIAQIAFGLNLLLNGKATSDMQVISILQAHINEVDELLETTLEDFDLTKTELNERIDHLRLPMLNMDHFERMLEDRGFRLEIVEGNEKIEHILARTSVALTQSVEDITEGLRSTQEFITYLKEQQHGQWRLERPDVIEIFDAMQGNTDGWSNAFLDLKGQADNLKALVATLTGITTQIDRRAGEVSRRTRVGGFSA
jgi:hypothetical protein